jgi:Ca2+-binding EF-hand superfamily protein
MTVVTLNPMGKKFRSGEGNVGYLLRSRVKAIAESENSSDELILELINEIDDHKKGPMDLKNKQAAK